MRGQRETNTTCFSCALFEPLIGLYLQAQADNRRFIRSELLRSARHWNHPVAYGQHLQADASLARGIRTQMICSDRPICEGAFAGLEMPESCKVFRGRKIGCGRQVIARLIRQPVHRILPLQQCEAGGPSLDEQSCHFYAQCAFHHADGVFHPRLFGHLLVIRQPVQQNSGTYRDQGGCRQQLQPGKSAPLSR